MNKLEETEEVKKKRQVLPEKIKKDVGHFAWKYRVREARRYDEGMTWVSIHSMNLKEKRLETGKQSMKIISEKKKFRLFTLEKVGRPPLLSGEVFTEIRSIFSNLRISRAVMTVGNGVLNLF